jgi:hypothetical protein
MGMGNLTMLNPTAGVGFGADFVSTPARRGLTLTLGLCARRVANVLLPVEE